MLSNLQKMNRDKRGKKKVSMDCDFGLSKDCALAVAQHRKQLKGRQIMSDILFDKKSDLIKLFCEPLSNRRDIWQTDKVMRTYRTTSIIEFVKTRDRI